jgi:hypothetical protein
MGNPDDRGVTSEFLMDDRREDGREPFRPSSTGGDQLRKFFSASTIALVIAVLGASSVAAYGGHNLSAAACGGGRLVINVTMKVVNDADSGVGGNSWATDSYNRHLKVWQAADGTFCATARYQGHFVTNDGLSPSGLDTVSAGVKGTFHGGYRSTNFTGTLNPTPAYRTHGFIGTFNYQLGANVWSWTDAYFSSTSGFDLAWWGWQYKAGSHGRWVNSSDGNSGDITG